MVSFISRYGLKLLALPLLAIMLSLAFLLTGSMVRPATVHAQEAGATITVAPTAKLINRTTVRITVTATCSIPDNTTIVGGFPQMGVTVKQAAGRVITGGTTDLYAVVPCDGVAHTLQVDVSPGIGLPPFHGGLATVNAWLMVYYNDADGNSHSLPTATTGTVAIRIR